MIRVLPPLFGAFIALTAASIYPAHADLAQQGTCSAGTNAPAAVAEALDEVLVQVLESPLGSAPGAVVSVKTDDWLYVAAAGLADPDAGTPMDCAVPFQIGSNTKMMTAVVLLQLFEEGQLGLDDPLSKHLPEVAARLPNGDSIAIRHLAQHTSGVFSYTDNAPDGTPGLMEGDTTDPEALIAQLDPQTMIEYVIEHGQPNFAPGAEGAWSYSNTGYTLLGMIIEKLEGLPIGKSFETRIFGPLGMDDTYLWNGVPKPEFGLPRAFLNGTEYETTDWNMSQGWAAGGVISTIDDMHVFIEALVAGDLFRSSETLEAMQETVRTTNPSLLGYGLGLALKGEGLWGHGGQTLGYESDIAAGQGISMVAFGTSSTNLMTFGVVAITEALRTAGALPE